MKYHPCAYASLGFSLQVLFWHTSQHNVCGRQECSFTCNRVVSLVREALPSKEIKSKRSFQYIISANRRISDCVVRGTLVIKYSFNTSHLFVSGRRSIGQTSKASMMRGVWLFTECHAWHITLLRLRNAGILVEPEEHSVHDAGGMAFHGNNPDNTTPNRQRGMGCIQGARRGAKFGKRPEVCTGVQICCWGVRVSLYWSDVRIFQGVSCTLLKICTKSNRQMGAVARWWIEDSMSVAQALRFCCMIW